MYVNYFVFNDGSASIDFYDSPWNGDTWKPSDREWIVPGTVTE